MATRSAKPAGGNADEDNVRSGSNGGSTRAAEDLDEVGERLAALEQQLRLAGDRLLESAKSLSGAASKQMQLHPMAAFGVAFLAGMTVARLLRR